MNSSSKHLVQLVYCLWIFLKMQVYIEIYFLDTFSTQNNLH